MRSLVKHCLAVLLCLSARASPAKDQAVGDRLREEKVRCFSYLDASDQGVASVPRVKAMGFNCALAMLAGGPVERLLPLIEATDHAGLPLILVDYCDIKKYLATEQPGQRRVFIGADGQVAPHLSCPADARAWQVVFGQRALEFAQLRLAGHPSLCGRLVDTEDYSGLGDLACGGIWFCFCDQCFGSFLQSVGKGGEAVVPSQRQDWLIQHSLLDAYHLFQDQAVVAILKDIRKQIDALAPEFLLATYPWPLVPPGEQRMRVAWDARLARGLGTERAPFLLLAEHTYVWGYSPDVEELQAELRAQGLHFLAVTGFNPIPSEHVWWPEQMAASAYWASRRSDGYWIYVGDWVLLLASGRAPSGVWGDRTDAWVKQFTSVNRTIVSGRTASMPLLPLRPITDGFQLSDLYSPQCSSGTEMFVRRWSEIGLPWEGGELVALGQKAGAWLGFQRSVSRTDRYEISAWLTTGPDRPTVRLEVDGQPVGEAVDLYQRITMPGERVVFGNTDLTNGNHAFRLVATGKKEASTGYQIGLRAADIKRVGYSPENWWVIGPFDNTGEGFPAYDVEYPPEKELTLGAAYPGKGGQPVAWRQVRALPDGYLDLVPLFSERQHTVAYCLTYVYCPTDGPRTVLLGSDDCGKLFVNGRLVWGEAIGHSARRDQNGPRAEFHQGWNAVLLKVLQASGSWGAYFRVYDPQNGLKYSLVRTAE